MSNFSKATATVISASEQAATYARVPSKRASIMRLVETQTKPFAAAFRSALQAEAAFFEVLKKEVDFI